MSDLDPSKRCPKCRAWHGIHPLEHVKPGEDCGHDPEKPCKLCGHPVGSLSASGSSICCKCDCGGDDFDLEKFAEFLDKPIESPRPTGPLSRWIRTSTS